MLNRLNYDGSQLKQSHYLANNGSIDMPIDIIVGKGTCRVVADHMCDLEDLRTSDFIYSENMIHFLIEIPNNTDLQFGVYFQRWFNTRLADHINAYTGKFSVIMKGDDLLDFKSHVNKTKGKYSVSIAAIHNNAIVIHTGVNIHAGNEAPSFARNIVDLVESEDVDLLIENFIKNIKLEIKDVLVATAKVI